MLFEHLLGKSMLQDWNSLHHILVIDDIVGWNVVSDINLFVIHINVGILFKSFGSLLSLFEVQLIIVVFIEPGKENLNLKIRKVGPAK